MWYLSTYIIQLWPAETFFPLMWPAGSFFFKMQPLYKFWVSGRCVKPKDIFFILRILSFFMLVTTPIFISLLKMTLNSELSSFSLLCYSKLQRQGYKYKICIKPNVLVNKFSCYSAKKNYDLHFYYSALC